MEGLWKMPTSGLGGFVKKIGREMESRLCEYSGTEMGFTANTNTDRSYSLYWYNCGHSGQLMISRSEEGGTRLIVDRFWGIDHSVGVRCSSASRLRKVADIYDEIALYTRERFGDPISEHDGRSIHTAQLAQSKPELEVGSPTGV